MKNYASPGLVLLTLIISLASCKKWLTVLPQNNLTPDEQFASQAGFQEALSGVYIQLQHSSLYGKALTYGAIENMMNTWDVNANSLEQYLGWWNFTKTDVLQVFIDMAERQYAAIANVNEILSHIDDKRDVFTSEEMFEVVKGECLALRAFCHLDLLRLLGPVPVQANDVPILPYVTALKQQPHALINYENYKQKLLADLMQAEALLKESDPILKYSVTDLLYSGNGSVLNSENDFLTRRFIRLNYYAVKALLARASLWFGEQQKAYEAAVSVIIAANHNGNPKFSLGNAAALRDGDFNFVSEHLFSIFVPDLPARDKDEFLSGKLKKGQTDQIVSTQLYGSNGSDIRETGLWKKVLNPAFSSFYVIRKYGASALPGTKDFGQHMIPVIRLSEMYFIASETASGAADAEKWWNVFRRSRNLGFASLPLKSEDRAPQIAIEYHREFVAEGQSFYAYKRINSPKKDIIWSQPEMVLNYVIPLPAYAR